MAGPIFNRIYDLDYFDDSDVFLYIGDVWVDEVTSLQYVCRQDKTPLYGYASQLFDGTAAGHVLVQGSFTINFKEQGYLWAVLRRYFDMGPSNPIFTSDKKSVYDPVEAAKSKKLVSGKMGVNWQEKGGKPIVGSNGTQVSRYTIEQLTQGNATKQQRSDFYQDLSRYATFDTKSSKDKIFEDIVEAFEDEVWAAGATNEHLTSQIRRMDDNVFDDFDIYVVMGDYTNPKANHTVQKIVGVRLTSQGKGVSIGGGNIQEEYQFIARTVV
jgi:hypothetical protein